MAKTTQTTQSYTQPTYQQAPPPPPPPQSVYASPTGTTTFNTKSSPTYPTTAQTSYPRSQPGYPPMPSYPPPPKPPSYQQPKPPPPVTVPPPPIAPVPQPAPPVIPMPTEFTPTMTPYQQQLESTLMAGLQGQGPYGYSPETIAAANQAIYNDITRQTKMAEEQLLEDMNRMGLIRGDMAGYGWEETGNLLYDQTAAMSQALADIYMQSEALKAQQQQNLLNTSLGYFGTTYVDPYSQMLAYQNMMNDYYAQQLGAYTAGLTPQLSIYGTQADLALANAQMQQNFLLQQQQMQQAAYEQQMAAWEAEMARQQALYGTQLEQVLNPLAPQPTGYSPLTTPYTPRPQETSRTYYM